MNIGAARRDPTATATAIACLVDIGVQDVAAAETALAVLQQP